MLSSGENESRRRGATFAVSIVSAPEVRSTFHGSFTVTEWIITESQLSFQSLTLNDALLQSELVELQVVRSRFTVAGPSLIVPSPPVSVYQMPPARSKPITCAPLHPKTTNRVSA